LSRFAVVGYALRSMRTLDESMPDYDEAAEGAQS